MRRYSILWWSIMLPTSVVVGLPVYLFLAGFSDFSFPARLAIAIAATLAADLAIAAAMESVAPTKLNIGPGERDHESDVPAEKATVVSGFTSSRQGRVHIRGETWMATRLPGDNGVLAEGMRVSVVGRDGLSLVVASGDSSQRASQSG